MLRSIPERCWGQRKVDAGDKSNPESLVALVLSVVCQHSTPRCSSYGFALCIHFSPWNLLETRVKRTLKDMRRMCPHTSWEPQCSEMDIKGRNMRRINVNRRDRIVALGADQASSAYIFPQLTMDTVLTISVWRRRCHEKLYVMPVKVTIVSNPYSNLRYHLFRLRSI